MFSTGPMAAVLVVALAILGLVSPAAAQGQASPGWSTGGGKIIPPGPSLQADVTFGFEFHGPDFLFDPPKGTCLVVDKNLDVTVHCFDPFDYVQFGDQSAVIFGNADVNGIPTIFRMEVNDGGDSGAQEIDTFDFVTQSGYSVAGVVFDGNIDVHLP